MRRAILLVAFAGCQTAGPREAPETDRIIDAALASDGAYAKLEELCDGVGNRLSGSESLDRAIEWAVATLKKDGHENVHTEKVMVPKWVRGRESLEMIEPRRAPISMLGLGGSVATPPEGITAEVLVVRDESQLDGRAKGKIVLFNNPMPAYDPVKGAGYGETVKYRVSGARLASEKGAVACLVRSVTAKSLRTPHTGGMRYGDAKVKIPAAAVSTEDASMMARLAARGVAVAVCLKMEARDEGMVPSANVIAELRGTTDEVVVIGGHIDSWDVGQGAHDDGAGCVIAMEALTVLRRLGLKPRRTIRVVLWTNEENGLAGARQYAEDHKSETHAAAIESDIGGFRPTAFGIQMEDKEKEKRAAAQLAEILKLLSRLGDLGVKPGDSGADVSPLLKAGVPCLGLDTEGSKYFDYHHTPADTFDKVDPRELSQCVAAMAAVAWALAERPGRLGE